MSQPVPSRARRRDGLRARWMRAFALLVVVLVLGSAGCALGTRIVSSGYRDTAERLETDGNLLSRLQGEIVSHAAFALTVDTPVEATELAQLEPAVLADFLRVQDMVVTRASKVAARQAQIDWAGYAAAVRDRPDLRMTEVRDLVTSRVPPVLAAVDQLAEDGRVATRAQLDRSGRIERNNLIVLGISVLIALTLCLRLLRRLNSEVLEPVETLRAVAVRLAAGDLTVRVNDVPDNEVGELGTTINAMADAIEATQQQLAHDASHDSLTELANRTAFTRAVEDCLQHPGRGLHAVVFIDLDGFKAVNDEYGHAAGDALLRVVAARLQAAARPGDVVARLGGDEFAVLLRELPDEQAAHSFVARAKEAVRAPIVVAGRTVRVGASAGIGLREDSSSADSLLHEADLQMYECKTSGRRADHGDQPDLPAARTPQVPIR